MAEMGERWMAEALAGLHKHACMGAKLYRGDRVEGEALAQRFEISSATFLRPIAKHVQEIRVFRRWPAARENPQFSQLLIRSGRAQFLDTNLSDAFDVGLVWQGAVDTGLMPIFVLGVGVLREPQFVAAMNAPWILRNPGVMLGSAGLKFARNSQNREEEIRLSPSITVHKNPELLVFAAQKTLTEVFVAAVERSQD